MADLAQAPSREVSDSPDPMVPIDEIAESSPDVDFASHVRTFNAVLSLARWFLIHVAILLIAVYFFLFGGQPGTGLFFLACSIGLLVYGVLRRPSVRADLAKAVAASPATPAPEHVDTSPGEGDRTA